MTLSVRVQPRDGSWIELGAQQDGGLGVMPGSIEYDGDLSEYGCLSASFRVKQNPRWIRQYLEHFTPVVIADGSDHVWSGRIIATPTTFGEDDVEVVVQCQGWGQHLKDDCTDREWVIADLSRWVDSRTMPNIDLTRHKPFNGTIENTGHAIMFTIPNGTPVPNDCHFFVCLDAGPGNTIKSIAWDWQSSANDGVALQYIASDDNASGTFDESVSAGAFSLAGAQNYAHTFTTARRYVFIGYYRSASATYGADFWFRITGIRAFTDSSDLSGTASILKASTVISETLAACCPLISTDTSKITTTTTSIPNFPGSPGYRYANELIDQANSIHGYVTRLSPDPVPVFEFSPQPTDYSFVVGGGEYTLLEPAAQDGRGVFSRVITEYEDAAGVRGEAEVGNDTYEISPTQVSNPHFEVDASGWTAFLGSIARSTVTAYAGTGSLALTSDGSGIVTAYQTAVQGVQLTPNRRYILRMAMRRATASSISGNIDIYDRSGANYLGRDLTTIATLTNGVWTSIDVPFTTDASGFTRIQIGPITGPAGTLLAYVDSLELLAAGDTVVDRRGFQRTALRPMTARSTSAIATAIAQLELDSSQYPPFKGTIGVVGRIRTKGGASFPVSVLPSRVGDRILIQNLTDPNTGALGRSGIIQAARYDHAKNRAELIIDSAENHLKILRNRLQGTSR